MQSKARVLTGALRFARHYLHALSKKTCFSLFSKVFQKKTTENLPERWRWSNTSVRTREYYKYITCDRSTKREGLKTTASFWSVKPKCKTVLPDTSCFVPAMPVFCFVSFCTGSIKFEFDKQIHCKKRLAIFLSPAGRDVTNQTLPDR